MADKKPIKITETVLRDAHQSLIATRMTTEQMLPIVDKMDKVGYNAVECWALPSPWLRIFGRPGAVTAAEWLPCSTDWSSSTATG